jgi:hypothetical protein
MLLSPKVVSQRCGMLLQLATIEKAQHEKLMLARRAVGSVTSYNAQSCNTTPAAHAMTP